MPERTYEQNHYEVLDLPSPHSSKGILTEQDIKLAYRRALLLHHPDKSKPSLPTNRPSSIPTIDQITAAYKILIYSATRSEYNRYLTLNTPRFSSNPQTSHPGLETIDLDDLSYDDEEGVWYRGCRCGRERAFVVGEKELESNAEYAELVTGCQGCSLWLRVTFAVAEDG